MALGRRIRSCLLPLLALSPLCVYAVRDPHEHDHDEGLFSFVTRPEIKAPKWKINVTDPARVSPGYWFVAPFEHVDQKFQGHGWIGPTIYDGDGELIWSGVEYSENWDTLDFKMSKVRGEDMMTFVVQKHGDAIALDTTFTMQEKHRIGVLGKDLNSHELSFLGNGSTALILTEGRQPATALQTAEVGWDGNCTVMFDGFKELNTTTWEPIFEWNSFFHISLNDSSYLDGGIERWCKDGWGWDFMHANSVDKDQDGNYYLSARHTDSIYKISKDDGHVMWRLHGGGENGSFTMNDVSFSRQHNVRFRGFDGTYEYITILDNAKGQDNQHATHPNSRGMMIALNINDMSAVTVSTIEHPDGRGHWAPRRGNYQQLPNGNVFMGWSEQAVQSEHTSDGALVMEATLVPEWLGTYRAYKYDFVGRPTELPKAYSATYPSSARNSTTTLVHMSWNGATEVAEWRLYKTSETGHPKIPLAHSKKTGFETALSWDGFAKYIIADAHDKDGNLLNSTGVVESSYLPREAMGESVAEELYWLQELRAQNGSDWKSNVYEYAVKRPVSYSMIVFVAGVVCSVGIFVLVRRLRHRTLLPLGKLVRPGSASSSATTLRYSPVAGAEHPEMGEVDDEERLSAGSSSWSRDRLL